MNAEVIHRCKDGSVWVSTDQPGMFRILQHLPSEGDYDHCLYYMTTFDEAGVMFDSQDRPWIEYRGRLSNMRYQWVDGRNPIEFASATVYWGGDLTLLGNMMLQQNLRRYWRFAHDSPMCDRISVADPWPIWAGMQYPNWQVVGDIAMAPLVTGRGSLMVQPYLMSPTRGIYRTNNILGLMGQHGELVGTPEEPVLLWGGVEYPVGE